MRRWDLTLTLDPEGEQPIFLQLASAISADIQRGRLKSGDPLPGSRALAEGLRISRNSVIAAYGELAAEGLIETRRGGGTFVADRETIPFPIPAIGPRQLGYALQAPSTPAPRASELKPGTLFLAGEPDARLLPARALARAFHNAIGSGRRRSLLANADPRGHPLLRAELSKMLSRTRGLASTAEGVLVTRGVVQGIDFVARTLLSPGDVVAVEALGYPPAWNALRLAGARLAPVALDEGGLDLGALEALLKREKLRAVLVTPHHQFPTCTVMSPARRERLAALASKHCFAILEDDYDHEFHYEGRPLLPIAARSGLANTIYIGSLANLLAPGICAGFVVAAPVVLERFVALRVANDARTDAAVECALAELFEDGELLRHARRVRGIYGARRDALCDALSRHLGGALQFKVPDGGMALWALVDPAIDCDGWVADGGREGVVFGTARQYDLEDRAQQGLRLGFTFHDERELEEAVRRMARALAARRARRA